MSYCKNCGKQLSEEAVFCPECGCATGNSFPVGNKNDSLSALSIIGFVFAFLESLVGLICSILAYKNAVREGDAKSRNFSTAGIVISAVFLVLQIICVIALIALCISFANEPAPYPPYYY